jgi:hypothetical protein
MVDLIRNLPHAISYPLRVPELCVARTHPVKPPCRQRGVEIVKEQVVRQKRGNRSVLPSPFEGLPVEVPARPREPSAFDEYANVSLEAGVQLRDPLVHPQQDRTAARHGRPPLSQAGRSQAAEVYDRRRWPSGPPPLSSRPTLPPVLTDEEAEKIRRKLTEGWRGPILLRWIEQLLRDRDERRQRERDSEPPKP